jgi:hypothetical protein
VFAALAVMTTLSLASGVAARSFVIQADFKLGDYPIKRDGSLAGALEAFGPPSSIRKDDQLQCVVRWRRLGLRIVFYNLGGRDPCVPRFGRFSEALVTGRQWRTASGLAIGDPETMLLRRHPRARHTPTTVSWWSLVVRRSPFGARRPYGALQAKIHRGRVSAFVIFYPAGGD